MNAGARQEYSRTALVLAGGGLTGAVYEIGALRAIDDLLIDRTVNDFDVFVGTSAGAFVSSLLANGLRPEIMLRTLDGSQPEIQPVGRRHVFALAGREIVSRGVGLPGTVVNAWFDYLRHRGDATLFDLLWALADALPSGLHDNLALERYVRQVLSTDGRTNDFDELAQGLYIIATDLDTGERVVFGKGEQSAVPISLAVAASSAVPLVYKPVRIGDRDYVDGGLRGPASLDLAVEHGATLVVCINPLVPFDNTHQEPLDHLSEKGGRFILSQALRIYNHASLHYHIKQLRRSHPDVDVILIEPRPDDYQMFFYNIMRYSARLTIARHGFESVTLDLAEDYYHYKEILSRHGIPISRRVVIEKLAGMQASGYDAAVIREALAEGRPVPHNGSRRGSPEHRLSQTLAELDLTLDEMAIENEDGS